MNITLKSFFLRATFVTVLSLWMSSIQAVEIEVFNIEGLGKIAAFPSPSNHDEDLSDKHKAVINLFSHSGLQECAPSYSSYEQDFSLEQDDPGYLDTLPLQEYNWVETNMTLAALSINSEGYNFFLIDDHSNPAGYLSASPYSILNLNNENTEHTWYELCIYLAEGHQGKGSGKKFIEAVQSLMSEGPNKPSFMVEFLLGDYGSLSLVQKLGWVNQGLLPSMAVPAFYFTSVETTDFCKAAIYNGKNLPVTQTVNNDIVQKVLESGSPESEESNRYLMLTDSFFTEEAGSILRRPRFCNFMIETGYAPNKPEHREQRLIAIIKRLEAAFLEIGVDLSKEAVET